MAKLFGLESANVTDGLEANDLLIDKVLKLADKSKDPVSVTADVIKQRQELKKDIQKRLDTDSDDDKDGGDSDVDNDDKDGDEDADKDSSDGDSDSTYKDSDDKDSGDDKDKEDSSDSEKKDKDDSSDSNNKDEEDLSKQADDEDSLKGIIGSGLSGSDAKDSKEDKKPAQESYKSHLTLSKVFTPLKNTYSKYLVSLESFNVPKRLAIEEQPVVYVKEAVVESLNNLITIANNYIGKNKTFIDSNIEAIKNINARLTVLKQFIKNEKYHFTNVLVNDQTLLSEVSIVSKSDMRSTVKILTTYIEHSNKFVGYILTNDFNTIASALGNANFTKEDDDFVYKAMLPGFNIIRVHLDKYDNYLKTNIENFHFYQLKTFKTEHLYELDAISISDDADLNYIIEHTDKLLIDLSMSVDNFNVVNSNLNKLIDELKVLSYDVEQDKHANLPNLDIDSKVKDFIKFKLVSEAYYANMSMLLNYILNADTIINKCIELK